MSRPSGGASPGLLRRRYSAPETVMRKYRLAQLRSESEEGSPATCCGGGCAGAGGGAGSGAGGGAGGGVGRRSVPRRLWAPASLHASRAELHSPPRRSPPAWATPKRQRLVAPAPLSASTYRSHAGRDALSASASDAAPPRPVSADVSLSASDLTVSPPTAVESRPLRMRRPPLAVPPAPYELLEIVVSETSEGGSLLAIHPSSPERAPRAPRPLPANALNIDEYVSNILVESLNSLTDQLESMTASMGDHRVSVVEKEIKVKLQNAGVNTVVHLSPTSNHQIIFGNEELCCVERTPPPAAPPPAPPARDVCNNPRERNNNELELNTAVLHQIQKLFQDELHEAKSLVHSPGADEAGPDEDARGAGREALGGVGAGNYYDPRDEPLVPRYAALPYSDSMEVNTSSSEDGEPPASDCTSLVDSLDDPRSPRAPPAPPPAAPARRVLARSALALLDLLPDSPRPSPPPHRDKGEAFFVRIRDDDDDEDKENAVVAESLPERIRQRLRRRQRTRELRMELARRRRTAAAAREVERSRRCELRAERRERERECRALLDELLRDVIAKVARDELACLRIKHKPDAPQLATVDDRLPRLKKPAAGPLDNDKRTPNGKISSTSTDSSRGGDRRHVRGRLSLLTQSPPAPLAPRLPRRLYQKSEIHDGSKCVEILEILEYPSTSGSSGSTDEARRRRSRIPVPVAAARRARRASVPGEAAPARARSSSLRLRRVCDVIPEESPPPRRAAATMTSPHAGSRCRPPAPLHAPLHASLHVTLHAPLARSVPVE